MKIFTKFTTFTVNSDSTILRRLVF